MKTKSNILVIDDEKIVCESFRSILNKEGYHVETRISPREGLDLAVSQKYNLVFLDLKMQEMDGIELFRKLREKAPELPVVIVTGYPSLETAMECIKLHAADYIIKPFTPDDILELTRQIIPEVSPLRKDYRAKLREKTVFHEWKSSGKQVCFHETAWLQEGVDGTVRTGAQLPVYFAENVKEIYFPEISDVVYQGLPLAGALVQDGSKIVIPSPVCGRIIDVNRELLKNPSLLEKNSFNESWIARVEPADLKKDLLRMQQRNVVLMTSEPDEMKKFSNNLKKLGYGIKCVDTVEDVLMKLKGTTPRVVFVHAESFPVEGPSLVRNINKEIPDAKIIIIGKLGTEPEKAYRNASILYHCSGSVFSNEVVDVLHCVFTSFRQDSERLISRSLSLLPPQISRIHITNKYGKKVSLLIFGDKIHYNKGIGSVMIDKLLKEGYPLEVTRGISRALPEDPEGIKKIAAERKNSDLVIILHARDSKKIPGQLVKETWHPGTDTLSGGQVFNLFIQPDPAKQEQLIFNNSTSIAIAELLLDWMTMHA